jgi:hypothetical protein
VGIGRLHPSDPVVIVAAYKKSRPEHQPLIRGLCRYGKLNPIEVVFVVCNRPAQRTTMRSPRGPGTTL